MKRENIRQIFEPRSIAVIGASSRPGSVGRALLTNILMNGYSGVVYPVNPVARSVLGVKAYPSVRHVPDDVDLAIIIVPAVAVPATIEECGQKGVKATIVISAGFKEMGGKGALLERTLRDKARKYNIAMVGPNCFGMINSDPRIALNTTFGRVMPRHGRIAFISQSGAVGIAALELADAEQIGLSKFVSIGNKADVNENDLLAFLKDDPETSVIILYLEDLVAPREFLELARQITGDEHNPKPILAIKSGRTSEGARAASSHTGALAGSDEAYDAFFNQCGIQRVDTINELFEDAVAFAGQPVPRGKRVAILTNAGGVGIMATDACVRNGLTIASFTDATREKMRSRLPATASITNPVDVIGDADEQRYTHALGCLLEDEGVDGAIAIWTPTLMAETSSIARTIAEVAPRHGKPVMGCLMSLGDTSEIKAALERAAIPHFRVPESAARALAAMCEYGAWQARPRTAVRVFRDVQPDRVRALVDRITSRTPRFIAEPEAHEILGSYGLPVLPGGLTGSVEEAVALAARIGYPLVLKIVSPQILHKTDVGGVRVNVTDETRLRAEYPALLAEVRSRQPAADLWGVFVQKMAPRGTETIIGMTRDPRFGPLLMFGLGGIYVEVMRDVAFRVAPIRELSAHHMIDEIRGRALLEGFRGEPPADRAAIAESLQRLSQLAVDFAEFAEIDINPLVVYAEGAGAAVLDARIIIRPEP